MLSVTILGNNSAIPAYGRHPTSQVVQNDEENFLIDCGEGTQMRMTGLKIKHSRINHIFISHLHGDHYFGLIGLLTSMALLSRKNDINIYAPNELKSIIELQLNVANAVFPYKLNFHSLETAEPLFENNKITISSFPVYHRIPCWGFIFRQKRPFRKIDVEKANQHNVPTSFYENLHLGQDYAKADNTIVKNHLLTLPPLPIKTYAFCGDTMYHEEIASKVAGVDLLYHEATYLHSLQHKAGARFHATSKEAALIAKKASVNKLILGHFSSQYECLDPFLTEAREVFPNTEIAEEGTTFLI